MKYQTKHIYVDAVPCRELIKCAMGNWAGLPKWMLTAYEAGNVLFLPTDIRLISLAGTQGTVIANIGDMVLCDATTGFIFPVPPANFAEQYEPAP